MVYPNRSVGQHLRLERRRGGALASGCVPPMRASRRAASRSTNAFNASRTTADFSVTPANSCALANNSSSIVIVAFIPPAPLRQIWQHLMYLLRPLFAEGRITCVTLTRKHPSEL